MDTTWQQLGLGMFSSTSFFFFLLKFILWGGLARKKKGGPRFFLPVCVISVCSRWREGRGRYEMPQVVFFFVLSQVKSISFFSPPFFFQEEVTTPFWYTHTRWIERERDSPLLPGYLDCMYRAGRVRDIFLLLPPGGHTKDLKERFCQKY